MASFSNSLVEALRTLGDQSGVVSVVDEKSHRPHTDVVHEWVRGSSSGPLRAAAALNRLDVAIVQHEYGIFPGRDGAEVLNVVRNLRVPTITVLHTVLVTPSAHQRAILEELAARSAAIVTMTQTASDRLLAHYAVDPSRVSVIPHGAADNRSDTNRALSSGQRPMILTWGLLGRGKGIEWAIRAMPSLRDLQPQPRYHVVGQTHPKVVEREGERYRDGLIRLAREQGVLDSLVFDARYLNKSELNRVIQRADVVLLPYDSTEQVTSGVLIEAVTAGKPVISTGFPHARELLAGGAGILVERQDPASIAHALRRVLSEPALAASMSAEAVRITPELLWPSVAEKYHRLALDAVQQQDLPVTA